MSILVATVPRSGTMFLYRLLASHGVLWRPLGEGGEVEFVHLSPYTINAVRKYDGPLVMTIRDRAKIQRSWERHAKRFDGTVDEALTYFDELRDGAVIIDLDARTGLAELSRLVGIELKTDWGN